MKERDEREKERERERERLREKEREREREEKEKEKRGGSHAFGDRDQRKSPRQERKKVERPLQGPRG